MSTLCAKSVQMRVGLILLIVSALTRDAVAIDCNGNGISDTTDLHSANLVLTGARSYGIGDDVGSMVPADFNGDNTPDLATLSPSTNVVLIGVSVLLGNGDGTFADAALYPLNASGSLIALDLNGDGKADLAAITRNELFGVTVLLNKGDGTFKPAVLYPVRAQGTLIAADLNGDGKLDFAMGGVTHSGDSYDVSVLLNQGDGTFDGADYLVPGNPRNVGLMLAADFNNDGKADLAFTTTNVMFPGVSVLINQGDGSFIDAAHYPIRGTPGSLIAVDLNRDGKLDLATLGDGLFVLLNNGDSTFAEAVMYSVGFLTHSPLVSADLNGDGHLDLAVTGNGMSVFLNHGDGSFGIPMSYPAGPQGSLVVADFDDDGSLDCAGATPLENNSYLAISIHLNHGDGTFEFSASVAAGGSYVIVIDADGNGMPDLATANRSPGEVSVLLNQGGGVFTFATTYPIGNWRQWNPYLLIAFDFNGDENPDLAVSGFDTVSILLNRGDGTFGGVVRYPVGGPPFRLIAADLDGDGKPDIVTANDGSSDVSVLYNRGDGTFRDVVYYPILLDQRVEALSLIAADLDDDGKPDIGIGYRFCDEPGDRDCESGVIHSGIAVLLNQSNGIFKAPASYPVFGGQTLTATDLNGDGKLDFATDGVYVLLNNGDGTFALARHYPGQFLRITADLNMDGKPDLVTADNGHYSVLLNQGDGTFKVPVEYPGCALRGMVDTDFGRRWTAISREAGQPFQAKVDTDFRGIWTGLRAGNCQSGSLRGPRSGV